MPDSTPAKRGPRTPEGRARSAMNALKHGLRARRFLLLPEEDPAEFQGFAEGVRVTYRPCDPVEAELVEGITVAMWRAMRADRVETETMADIPPVEDGRSCGTDLVGHSSHRASLETALRYRSQAQLELQRALNLLLRHRRTKAQIVAAGAAAAEEAPADAAFCTNEMPCAARSGAAPSAPPAQVPLREAARRARDPMDDPVLHALGRNPDLVLPVRGVHPTVWPMMQRQAEPGPYPPDGPQPYRRVPGLPAEAWYRSQHLLQPGLDAADSDSAVHAA